MCNSVLLSTGYRSQSQPHGITLSGDPAVLRGRHGLGLTVFHYYRLVVSESAWRVQTTGYRYALRDASGREVLAYHWHPTGVSPITFPHLHAGPAAEVGFAPFAQAHLPTRRLAIEEILQLAITDFSVVPLRGDWRRILAVTMAERDEHVD